jgi:hypothetical protein
MIDVTFRSQGGARTVLALAVAFEVAWLAFLTWLAWAR